YKLIWVIFFTKKITEYILEKIYEDYLFAQFYKKKHFFPKFLYFFIYIAKIIKIPVVNKYHQNKALSVSKKMVKN
ncbi:unnamed protein product, partial [Staurois parvus]